MEIVVLADKRRLLVQSQIVELLMTMLDVTLPISLLTVFHTVECVEW